LLRIDKKRMLKKELCCSYGGSRGLQAPEYEARKVGLIEDAEKVRFA
jgi:hypothetical protein